MHSKRIDFVIMNLENANPILGLKDYVQMNLVTLIRSVETPDSNSAVMEEYKDVIDVQGCLEKPYHIQIKPDATHKKFLSCWWTGSKRNYKEWKN